MSDSVTFFFDIELNKEFFTCDEGIVEETLRITFGEAADSIRVLIPLVREYGIANFFDLPEDEREDLLQAWSAVEVVS